MKIDTKLKKLVESCVIKYRRKPNSTAYVLNLETIKEALEEYFGIEIKIKETDMSEKPPTTREILLQMQVQLNRVESDVSFMKKDIVELKKDVSILKKDMVEVKTDLAIIKSVPIIKEAFEKNK